MRTLQVTLPLLAALVAAAVGCKPRQAGSELRDLNAGQEMSEQSKTLLDDPAIRQKKVVLIYYANDTYAPHEEEPAQKNRDTLLRKIRASAASNLPKEKKDRLEKTAARISDDWVTFRRTVIEESDFLKTNVCRENNRLGMGLAIFRNSDNDVYRRDEYLRDLKWSWCSPDGSSDPNARFQIPSFRDDFRYQSQPLSHKSVFKKALEEVFKVFPPGLYRYILITKSHGSSEMALTPHLTADVSAIPEAEIWSAIADRAGGVAGLGNNKDETPTLGNNKDETPTLNEVNIVLGSAPPPAGRTLPQPAGVTKRDYIQILYDFGGQNPRQGMFFPLVFMESCKSDLKLSRDEDLASVLREHEGNYKGFRMENVGLLFTSDMNGLGYRTINYEDLLNGFRYRSLADFQDRLRQYLNDKAKKN